jgi:3,4-dihydroxy 2-butanone 4-phosphate synthase/GTP cyclohydrolase II
VAFASVVEAVEAIAAGKIVMVVDNEHRENEGDLIIAAEYATPEALAFFVRHTSGFICTAITSQRADELKLPLMVPNNTERQKTAFTVTVDYQPSTRARGGSAVERARTARALVNTRSRPEDFDRPGHMHVLRAEPLGVLSRPGHTEAAVDLARLAGLSPAGVLCELVTDDGLEMATGAELEAFAERYGLPLIRIDDLIRYRRKTEQIIRRVDEYVMPTEVGEFRSLVYTSVIDGWSPMAFVMGSPPADQEILVGVHRECLAGNVFGSWACSCRQELEASFCRVAREGQGVVVYLRGAHLNRGRMAHQPDHTALRTNGRRAGRHAHQSETTFDEDERDIVSQVLTDLGIKRVSLISTSDASPWQDLGLEVEASGSRLRLL